jgi:hypothetical protein
MSRVAPRVALERASTAETAVASSRVLEPAPSASRDRGSLQRRWLKRFGAVGFAFFLLKGLFWLTVPALLAYFARR